MLIKCLLLVLPVIAATRAASLPHKDDSADVAYLSSPSTVAQIREKRSAFPGRAMMFHGYFGNGGHPYRNPVTPHEGYDRHDGRSYDPQRAMTAFAAGDSGSAGSAYFGSEGGGSGCRNCNGAKKPANVNGNKKKGNGQVNGNGNRHPTNGNGFHQHEAPADTPAVNNDPVDENAEEQKPVAGHDVGYPNDNGNGYLGDQPAAEETPKGETVPPAAPTLPAAPEGPKKGTAADNSEEEEEDDEPLFFIRGKGKGRGQGPYYNSYFPIVFGAYPGFGAGRGRNWENGDGNNPGVATAIANSFSTGRGAVATSHATAYGSPQYVPSGYRKNGSRGRPQ